MVVTAFCLSIQLHQGCDPDVQDLHFLALVAYYVALLQAAQWARFMSTNSLVPLA